MGGFSEVISLMWVDFQRKGLFETIKTTLGNPPF